jgi:adenylate cyclase
LKVWIGFFGTLAVLAVAGMSGVSVRLNRWVSDAHWTMAARRAPSPFDDVLIVAVDDKTLKAVDPATGKPFGRPGDWSRGRYARLLDRLALAKVVGLDILFLDESLSPEGDEALVQAVQRHGRVVLGFNLFAGVPTASDAVKAEVQHLLDRCGPVKGPDDLHAVPWYYLQPPLPRLVDAAAALGSVDVAPDPDGIFRHVPLARRCEDSLLPHFTLAMAAVADGLTPAAAVAGPPTTVALPGRQVPIPDGLLDLRPITRHGRNGVAGHPVPTVSFCDALNLPPERFRDKIVLVGETASGTTDIRPNPLDRDLRGVELNAEILANLLVVPPVRFPPANFNLLLMAMAVFMPLIFFSRLKPQAATIASALSTLVIMGCMEVGFWWRGYVTAWAPVLLGALSATLIMGLQRLMDEERQKRQIRASFSMYVAPEVVAMIAEDPSIARQEGTRQRMCVLFSDVRSFTTYCEDNEPELVVRQMREYLSAMTESVESFQGVLDKFVGDAVMALFGPFLEDDTAAAALAVACALDMLDRLARLNADWAAEDLPQFKIGVGLHYGSAILGNIGSERKMQYTALGDTVNTAARLESMTKELNARVVVSEEVRSHAAPMLDGLVEFKDLGQITVRNRARPVSVFEARRPDQEQPI